MRVLIENYRGWEIHFDTDKEEFYTISNEYDTDKTKKSYAASKKFIDDYIKENSEFKPIKVEKHPSHYNNREVITLIGIRKDGAFMYEDKNSKKGQLSTHNEKDYFLQNHLNEPIFEAIEALNIKINELRQQVKEQEKLLIKVDVKQFRKNLLGEK